MTDKFPDPIHFRDNKRDEEVRRASAISDNQQPRAEKYRPYEAEAQQELTGGFNHVGQMFKPDKPTGKPVAKANDGPDTAWPGKYPSEDRRL